MGWAFSWHWKLREGSLTPLCSMPGLRSEAMMYLFVYCCDRSGARLRARPRDTGTLTTLPSLGGRCRDRQHGAVSSEMQINLYFIVNIATQ